MEQIRHEGTLPGKTLTRVDDGYIAHTAVGQIPRTVYSIHSFAFGDFEIKLKLPVTFVDVCAVTAGLVLNIAATCTIWAFVKYNSVSNV